MDDSPTPPLVSRRRLVGGALGAAGVAALASPSSAWAAAATAPAWTNVLDLGADPTGAADSTSAFQTAIRNGLPIYVPPGTYTCSRGPLVAAPWMRIFGNSYGTTTIQSSGCHLFDMDNANGLLEGVEIDHLTLSASGGDVFHGAHITRSCVHDCWLVQNSAGNAIWNASASTGQGTTYMHECCFRSNKEHQYGSPRSINAWYLNANGISPFITDNWWEGCICYNEGHDTTQWWYRIIGPGSGLGGRNNTFHKLTFEYPQGGMIRLESCTGSSICDVTSEGLASLAVGKPLVSIGTTGGNSAGCAAIAIRGYSRRGGNNNGHGITDIQLDANAVQLMIDSPSVAAGGSILTLDMGNAQNVTLIGSPGTGNYTVLNASGLQLLS